MRGYAGDGALGVGTGARNEVESTSAFAVETEVFGEGLSDAEFEALVDEVADCPGVIFEIAGCETLVGAVEEGEVFLCAYYFGEFYPLFTGGVDACGIVGAGVQEDNASFGGLFDGGAHAGEVEAFGGSGEVGVGFYGEMDVAEDLVVVGPCWGGEVDGLGGGTGVEA